MNRDTTIDALLEEQPDVLSPDEVAQLLRVSSQTVLRWVQDGQLAVITLGPRLRRIRKGDLREFLLSRVDQD